MKLLLSLICIWWAAGMLYAQSQETESYHTERFDLLNPHAQPIGRYSGLTGYAAPDGREYALLGGYRGTYIIDVTEKPIRLVALVPGPGSDWREIRTYRNYAYVVNETGQGLQIIDLSTLPAPPTDVKFDSTLFWTAHTISREGDYIYVHGSDHQAGANGGTIIFNVGDDPLNPRRTGAFTGHYVHDAFIRNDTLYAAGIMDGKLSIVYLGPDKTNSELVTEITYPGAGTHNAAMTEDGRYLLTTDEIGSTRKSLKVWDVRDKNTISQSADFTPDPNAIVHNAYVKGDLAFVSWYMRGTRIIDIKNPAQPVEVGYFDAMPGTGPAFAGNWEVYPYLPSGKILASYMDWGLEVFTFDGVRAGHATGIVRDATSKEPIKGVMVRIEETGQTFYTNNEGSFTVSAAQGKLHYMAYAQDYVIETGELELTAEGKDAEILLRPLPLNAYSIQVRDEETNEPVQSFVYHIYDRNGGDGTGTNGTKQLSLPADSSYRLQIGAWGYQPKVVELNTAAGMNLLVQLRKGYYDDAELDLGWSFGVPTDRAFIGRWERGVPHPVTLYRGGETVRVQPGEDHTAGSGNQAFITGLSNPGTLSNPVFGGSTSLVSPPMDLSRYNDPYLNMALWFSNEGWYTRDTEIPLSDTLELLLSDDNGATWTIFAKLGNPTKGWKMSSFRVRDILAPNDRMRLMIHASDSIAISVVEAGMDDFSISDGGPSSVTTPAVAGDGIHVALVPNPIGGSGHLSITLPALQRNARLELRTILGEQAMLLHEGGMQQGATLVPIDVTGLPAGRYIWRLTMDDGKIASGAVVVVR